MKPPPDVSWIAGTEIREGFPRRRARSKYELRCFCRGEPLLAMYGQEASGQLYIHIKIYKQGRVYGESYHISGIVKIRCRNCLRWHKVAIVAQSQAQLEPTDAPMVAEENPPRQ